MAHIINSIKPESYMFSREDYKRITSFISGEYEIYADEGFTVKPRAYLFSREDYERIMSFLDGLHEKYADYWDLMEGDYRDHTDEKELALKIAIADYVIENWD